VSSGDGLAIATLAEALAFAVFEFVLVSALWQALRASPTKLIKNNKANRFVFVVPDTVRAAQFGVKAAVFIMISGNPEGCLY
jgi:hypothetical protein